MDYKKLIKSKNTRLKLLHMMRHIPDPVMVKLQYWMKMNRNLNLKDPQKFTEKLQWYKIYYRDPLMTQCADKFLVRDFVKSKGLEGILTQLYAVYKHPDEIYLEDLPDKFVVKTTNGSATNYFCTDKSKIDIHELKSKLFQWLKWDFYSAGREWAYKDVEPRIIVEEYLENKEHPNKE